MKKTILWYFALCVIVTGIAIFLTATYRLPDQLTFSGGDGALGEALIKSIQESGLKGNLFCDRLGAPDGSALVDTPFLDWLFVIQAWIISWFVKNPGRIMVIFYVVTYVTSAVSMFFCLNKLKCSRGSSFIFSLLFSFSTFHTFRNIGHLTLSNYYIVPIAIYLSFYIAFNGVVDKVDSPFANKNAKKNQVILYLFAIMIGMANVYFTAFGLVFMLTALLYRLVKEGHIKQNIKYAGYIFVGFLSFGVSLLPKWIYGIMNGVNEQGASRSFLHSEIFGLKLIQLLLPPYFSKFWGAYFVGKYEEGNSFISENRLSAIGLIAVIAFIGLCIHLIISFIKKKGDCFIDFLSLSVLIAVLVATVGGFGTIFNYFVTPEIRCYCRISIYIICFCYIAFAYVITKKKVRMPFRVLIFAVLLAIGGMDQITISNKDAWTGAGIQAEIYDSFFSQIEEKMPKGAMVYQLPFIEFPEPAVTQIEGMDAYNHLEAYVFTDTIKWSYGGMKGRNESAKTLFVSNGIGTEFLQNIRKAGFLGVYINMSAYTDVQKTEVTQFYSEELQLTPIVSQDGLLYFYDISNIK